MYVSLSGTIVSLGGDLSLTSTQLLNNHAGMAGMAWPCPVRSVAPPSLPPFNIVPFVCLDCTQPISPN